MLSFCHLEHVSKILHMACHTSDIQNGRHTHTHTISWHIYIICSLPSTGQSFQLCCIHWFRNGGGLQCLPVPSITPIWQRSGPEGEAGDSPSGLRLVHWHTHSRPVHCVKPQSPQAWTTAPNPSLNRLITSNKTQEHFQFYFSGSRMSDHSEDIR